MSAKIILILTKLLILIFLILINKVRNILSVNGNQESVA